MQELNNEDSVMNNGGITKSPNMTSK